MGGTHLFTDVQCPYCGEWIDLAIDPSVEAQQYVEDCQVCCRPMLVTVRLDGDGAPMVGVSAENEG